MERLSFECDYNEGAHPRILEALLRSNMEHHPGYGADAYCTRAKERIRKACEAPDADVYFLVGGTQTNKTVIDSLLRTYEGVVSAATGHIAAHEAGAIEATGHKVLGIPHREGKIEAATLRAYLETFYGDESHDHMVFPGMVYISHPTEYGTLYSKRELSDIAEVCRLYELPLFLDGARLGYGLVSEGTDVSLPDLAKLCDVFYIGGTKVGALCGEAVVFSRIPAPRQFMTIVKQNGALMAKGRVLGIQFDVLFEDGLYYEISRHAIALADRLREGFSAKGYEFYYATVTNQIFVILNDEQKARLSELVTFSFWERLSDGRTVVRFATSWATASEDVEKLIDLL